MVIKNILQIGNPRLRFKSQKIDPTSQKAKRAIKDLVDTMRASELVGMAAPQIRRPYRIFVAEIRTTLSQKNPTQEPLIIFINPKIIMFSKKETLMYEGCGSVAYGQIFGPVLRPNEVLVEAYGTDGKKFRVQASGLLAKIIQHECDHLDGVVFTDKLTDATKLMSLAEYVKARKANKIP